MASNTILKIFCTAILMESTGVYAAASEVTPFIAGTTLYRSEIIIATSVFMLILGAFAAVKYEPPIDVPKGSRMDTTTKLLFSVAGGIAAFIYLLDHEQRSTLKMLHPVWVFGVSAVTPSFVQVAFPIIVKLWYRFIKGKTGDNSDD